MTGYIRSIIENGSPNKKRPQVPCTSKTLEMEPTSPSYMPSIKMATLDMDRSCDSRSRLRKKTAINKMIDLRLDVTDFSAKESEDGPKLETPKKPRESKFKIKRNERDLQRSGRNTLVQSISGNKLMHALKASSLSKPSSNPSTSRRHLDSSSFLKGLTTPRIKLATPTSNSSSTVYKLVAMHCSSKHNLLK